MWEDVNSPFYAWVVIEDIVVKIAQLWDEILWDRPLKERGNVGFDKGNSFEGNKTLETLDKEHYILMIDVFAHKHYLAFSIRPIKMQVKIAYIRLILPFDNL